MPVAPQATALEVEVKAANGDDRDEDIINDYVKSSGRLDRATYAAVSSKNQAVVKLLASRKSIGDIPKADRLALRTDTYLVSGALQTMTKSKIFDDDDSKKVTAYRKALDSLTKFIPLWVIATALALGIGTTIGWKRIVKTVGEKIGSQHSTYGQGASAELVAYATIFGADIFGLPVSTTHVLATSASRGFLRCRSAFSSVR